MFLPVVRIGAYRVPRTSNCAGIFLPPPNRKSQNASDARQMGETLNLLFCSREDGTYELQVKESWSGHAVSGSFVPPYTPRQLTALLRKLNTLEIDDEELHDIGHRLFLALCGSETPGA
ncbi:MAG TPA: hypothetical protein VKB35_10015, partial [Ktedonobacteraceae bacterium]|nr:hypothetical protein [Ktedonobacteraceae bacterium]